MRQVRHRQRALQLLQQRVIRARHAVEGTSIRRSPRKPGGTRLVTTTSALCPVMASSAPESTASAKLQSAGCAGRPPPVPATMRSSRSRGNDTSTTSFSCDSQPRCRLWARSSSVASSCSRGRARRNSGVSPWARQHGLAPLERQQRDAQGLLQPRDRITDGRLAAMQSLGRLGESAPVDDRRQHRPLFQAGPGQAH